MTKTVLFASTAVLALTVAGFASAATHPGATSKGSNHFAHHGLHHAKGKVLWDQDTDDSGIGLVSQNFESSFDQYDAQGADDFTVPDGSTWSVTGVNTTGVYFNGSGPAASEHVTFYKDKKGHPGKVVADYPALSGDDDFGSFSISVPKTKLKAGHYWVSVYVNMDFSAGGEWGWENTATVQNGDPAQWQNPGGGFGTTCSSWDDEDTCIVAGQGPDHLFQIVGKSK